MVASHGLQKGHKNVCKRGIKRDVNQAEVGAFRSACMLISVGIYVYLGRDTCVPRSGYMCTSVGIRVYLGRDTCVPRSERDDHKASLTLSLRVFKDNRDNRDNFSRIWMSERYLFGM